MDEKNLTNNKIRIGINARVIQERMSGVPRFTLNLIEGLAKPERNCEIHLFLLKRSFASSAIEEQLSGNPNIFLHFSRWSGNSYFSRALWDLIFLGFETKRYRLDLFFGPAFTIPLVTFCPAIVMIHDLVLKRAPAPSKRLSPLIFRTVNLRILLPIVIRKATAIATCSESSRGDIVNDYGIAESRIYVLSEGVDENFQKLKDNSRMKKTLNRLGIRQPYIFNPSGFLPRKNQLMLIEAFARFKDHHPENFQLVFLGSGDRRYLRRAQQKIRHLGLEKNVLILPFVSEEDLVVIYNGATLCVYPSLYEGFGCPLLEAMACEIPVIAANTSSLPELVGDAGLLVAPDSSPAWTEAMNTMLTQEDLRQRFIEKGLRRVKQFSWGHTVEKTMSLFQDILNQ